MKKLIVTNSRLTRDAEFKEVSNGYTRVEFIVAHDRAEGERQDADFIPAQLLVKTNSKGKTYLEGKLKKGIRVNFEGDFKIDRWQDESENYQTKPYCFIESFSGLEIIDYKQA